MSSSKAKQAKYLDVQTASAVTYKGDENGQNDNLPSAVPVSSNSMNVETAFVKGTVQEPAYRDKWFGIVFLAHLGTMIAVAIMYANGTLKTVESDDPTRRLLPGRLLGYGDYEDTTTVANGNSSTNSYEYSSNWETSNQGQESQEFSSKIDIARLLSCFLMSLCSAPLLALVAMKYMLSHGVQLIQASIYFAIGLNVALGVFLVLAVDPSVSIWNFIFAAILACYARAVWHRIPFAAANLKAAVTCVQSNLGMVFLGLASIPIFAVWMGLWGFVHWSVLNSPWMKSQENEVLITDDYVYGRSNTHEEEELTAEGCMAVIALLLSFYWTWHVLRNVVHTSLAGTVGTWCFLPQEANGCCSRGLRDSLSRSLTYSFGSICFGSLLVAIIETMKTILQRISRSRRAGLLRLVAQCLLTWVERIAEYFNKWAFVYVGLYGYSYLEAGKNVYALFRHRGWSAIISDSLVHRMLGMLSLCIALVNALAAAIWTIGSAADVMAISAGFAFFMGFLMSIMTFGVLISAVDSIIVLFVEAPAQFKDNHPALCQELEDTWTQAWPDIFSPGVTAVASPVV